MSATLSRPAVKRKESLESNSFIEALRELVADEDQWVAPRKAVHEAQTELQRAEREFASGDPQFSWTEKNLEFLRRKVGDATRQLSELSKTHTAAWHRAIFSDPLLIEWREEYKGNVLGALEQVTRTVQDIHDLTAKRINSKNLAADAEKAKSHDIREQQLAIVATVSKQLERSELRLEQAQAHLVEAEQNRLAVDVWLLGIRPKPVANVQVAIHGPAWLRFPQWVKTWGPKALVPVGPAGIDLPAFFVDFATPSPTFKVKY